MVSVRQSALPVTCAAAFVFFAPCARAQLTYTARSGTNAVSAGVIGTGPHINHTFTGLAATDDPIMVTDPGDSTRPSSEGDGHLITTPGPNGISFSIVGRAQRGAPMGQGGANAASAASDQWTFSIAQTTCFTLDAALAMTSSNPAAPTQFFNFESPLSIPIALSDGTHPIILTGALAANGTHTYHYTGSLSPGNYVVNIGGAAGGNGVPFLGTYSAAVQFSVGPPQLAASIAPATACSSGTATFSVATTPPAGASFTYQWQWQQVGAGGGWTNLAEGPNADSGGVVRFTAAGAAAPAVAITGSNTPQGALNVIRAVRCIVTNGCGSVTSNAATLTLNSADFNNDGDIGTDADIEAFFACLAGNCCPTCGSADFNGDGDIGTDADIESFFRVLAGGNC